MRRASSGETGTGDQFEEISLLFLLLFVLVGLLGSIYPTFCSEITNMITKIIFTIKSVNRSFSLESLNICFMLNFFKKADLTELPRLNLPLGLLFIKLLYNG